ncbi:GIY-YIG nuclease family protein [Algoriphagus yeomjeoni]|uniref:Putative endonuclease n=1 Tax=Algoriphagus yeomjeoni TaxID=291403 RepID=A0A327NZR2_9BACT|nr:GIY-YIG nuclease family protein [Algoriphagus yeomjeoni]RAI85559.1 putative endonuclease [Algoriphagus yeomjeoni]
MFVYILTNKTKSTLYIGVTNDLQRRLYEHKNGLGASNSFTTKYKCHHLIYFEEYATPIEAISREKELKKWRREKKNNLIEKENPNWDFINIECE